MAVESGSNETKGFVAQSKAEVVMFLFCLAFYMPSAFTQNLLIQKVCLRRNHTRGQCLSDVIEPALEEQLQPEVTQLLLAHYLLRTLPAVLLSLFMGQWSDLYGRKRLMLISCAGNALALVLYWLNSVFMDWPAVGVVLSSLVGGASGDYAAFNLALFGFIRDIHPLTQLSLRISLADGSEALAAQLGPLIGGRLYSLGGYGGVYSFCVLLLLLNTLCILRFVDDAGFDRKSNACANFFNLSAFRACVRTLSKKREGNFRAYILGVMAAAAVISFVSNGHSEIIYLYTRIKVHWNVLMINYYSAAAGGACAIGTLVVLPVCVQMFGVSDVILGFMGHLGMMAFFFTLALARTSAMMFAACFMMIIGSLSYVTLRSVITKCVEGSEIGKVMAVYAVLAALSCNLGQIVSTQVYVRTYLTRPGAFFWLAGALLTLPLTIYAFIYKDLRKRHVVLEESRMELLPNDTH